RAAEQRNAHIAAHDEFLAAVFRMHLAAVHLAVLRVENVPAVITLTGLLHAVDDRHAEDRLILARIGAGRAAPVGLVIRAESLDDLAAQVAAGIGADLH